MMTAKDRAKVTIYLDKNQAELEDKTVVQLTSIVNDVMSDEIDKPVTDAQIKGIRESLMWKKVRMQTPNVIGLQSRIEVLEVQYSKLEDAYNTLAEKLESFLRDSFKGLKHG
jgi:hypothetical protein